MKHHIRELKTLLYTDIIKRKEINPFIIFACFILSFAIARLIVTYFPNQGLFLYEFHIHHFYYGIALLVISNWILLVSNVPRLSKYCAALFGIGLGLITDELGLLLTCSTDGKVCNYYARQSYDFLIFMTLAFFIIIYFPPIWHRVKKILKKD